MNMVLSDNKVIKNYDTLETGKKLYFRIRPLGSIHFHYSYISVLLEINENERKSL